MRIYHLWPLDSAERDVPEPSSKRPLYLQQRAIMRRVPGERVRVDHAVARPRDSASGYRQDIETKNVCSPPGRESSKAASTSSRGSGPIRAPQLQTIASSCRPQPTPSSDWLEPWRQLTERLPSRNFPRRPNRMRSRGLLAPGASDASWSCSTAIRPFFFRRKHSIYFDVAQTHGESLELLTECNKLPVGLDRLCDLLRVFPAQSLPTVPASFRV